jgi:hypothetical protein
MPRKRSATTASEQSEAAPETQADPQCAQCHAAFTWRDHAYGAASRNRCRRCDQQAQRAILRGSYLMVNTKHGLQPAISQGPNRAERRTAQRARRSVAPTRKTLRYAA